jgi:transglutaminase-like putative cysteine protease
MLARLASLPRDSRDTLFLLVVIGWLLLPLFGHLPLWSSALATCMLLWRARLAWGSLALPNKWWLLGLLIVAAGATLLAHRTLLGREAGVTLIVLLLTLKTLEMRARRDAFVVFFLGFFTLLTQFFYSQSLLSALGLLIGMLGLLTALVLAHMPVGKPPLAQAARIAGTMALLGAPLMLLLFLLFPRLPPLWAIPSDAMGARSGLGASMQVGNIARLALDGSVALRIAFDGAPPPQRELYFRGPVLANFDGREWRAAGSSFPARYRLPANLSVAGAPVDYEVTLEPTNQPWLFVLDAAADSPGLPDYRPRMNADLQWLADRPVTDRVRYRALSYPRFQHGPLQFAIGLQEYVELPPGFNPRTLALAFEIRRDPRYAQADAKALVQVVLERLRSGGYVYTLAPGLYGPNSADEFWFDRKQGFCEHIASAFVVLMRALDVPARIVTGYQGGERNPVDDQWLLRQSDAHAWAEVWQAGQGWLRVDPTAAVTPSRIEFFQRLLPQQGLVGQALGNFSPTLAVQLRAIWEALDNRWNQWVLNYTQSQQLDLLKKLGFTHPDLDDLALVLIGALVLISLLGVVWAWWERSASDPWLQLLARARRQLLAAGIGSDPASSPRQLARQVLARYGSSQHSQLSQAQAWHDWLLELEALRYARADHTAGTINAKARLAQLKKQLRRLHLRP